MNNEYFGRVRRIVDGDTLVIDTYQDNVVSEVRSYGKVIQNIIRTEGFEEGYRLIIIDTPERGDNPGYLNAKNALAKLVPPMTQVRLLTHGEDNAGWGRTLADVFRIDQYGGYSEGLSEIMLREGYAQVWMPR